MLFIYMIVLSFWQNPSTDLRLDLLADAFGIAHLRAQFVRLSSSTLKNGSMTTCCMQWVGTLESNLQSRAHKKKMFLQLLFCLEIHMKLCQFLQIKLFLHIVFFLKKIVKIYCFNQLELLFRERERLQFIKFQCHVKIKQRKKKHGKNRNPKPSRKPIKREKAQYTEQARGPNKYKSGPVNDISFTFIFTGSFQLNDIASPPNLKLATYFIVSA